MKNISFFAFLIFLISCASPQKHFNKGDYHKAYKEALKDLQKGSKDRKLKTLLNKSFNELLKANRTEVESLLTSNHIEDWEEAFYNNQNLIDQYEQADQYLDKSYDSTIELVENENKKLLDDMVLSYREFGDEQMEIFRENGNKLAAQDAYTMYSKVKSLDPLGSKDLDPLLDEAFEGGVIVVLVSANTWESRYDWDVDRIFKDIERESDGFYQVQYETNVPDADCIINVEFGRLDIDRRDRRRTESYSERVENGYRVEKDTTGRETRIPIYENVEAEVQIIEENYNFRWDVRSNVSQYSNYCDFSLSVRSFEAQDDISIENYEWRGDERAVPNRYRISRRNEISSRDEEDLIEDLIREVFSDIRRYYF